MPRFYAIIPSRYESSRFPGKPLAEIQGKPMFWHVYQRTAKNVRLSQTVLATDDHRIVESARSLDVPVIMTGTQHQSGTDRVFEAARSLGLSSESVIVNIQGDEPALASTMIDELLQPFADEQVKVSTLARRLDASEAERPDLVKVVIDSKGRAMYFSRSQIPYHHSDSPLPSYWVHIGLYAYRYHVLKTFQSLGPSPLEKAERLEQLRLLEFGIPIQVVETQHRSRGVDRPEDLAEVERLLSQEQV